MAEAKEQHLVEIPDFLTVRELAELIKATPIDVIKELMNNGIMASINQQIDFETAAIVLSEMGFEAQPLVVEEEAVEKGEVAAWRAVYQVTESAHMANAALWAATEPRCANQAYNITNGDTFRWCNLWPRIAEVFEMPWTEPQTISLVAHMADKAPLWEAMVAKHRLQPFRFDELVAWPFGDYVFACDWDVMSSVTKSRLHGFHDVVDSEEMFVRLLSRFRAERIVP